MADVVFKDNSAAVKRQMEKNIGAALEALGINFTSYSMEEMDRIIYHTPPIPGSERTGLLRNSQSYQVNRQDKEVIAGNAASYAAHVHFEGLTRNWGGRPWMTNTLNSKQAQLQAVVAEVFRRMMK